MSIASTLTTRSAGSIPVRHPEAQLRPPSLDDPSSYACVPSIPIIDTHEESRDDDGNITHHAIDIARLNLLADNGRRREARGNLPLITFGHTHDRETETDQPPPVGYARNLRVGTYLGEPMLLADLCVERQYADAARTYPRRSAEVWGGSSGNKDDHFVDVVALTRRAPRRDLGLVTRYARQPDDATVERHTMEIVDVGAVRRGMKRLGLDRYFRRHAPDRYAAPFEEEGPEFDFGLDDPGYSGGGEGSGDDCGTGAGGFQEGNTCAGEGQGGRDGGSEDTPSHSVDPWWTNNFPPGSEIADIEGHPIKAVLWNSDNYAIAEIENDDNEPYYAIIDENGDLIYDDTTDIDEMIGQAEGFQDEVFEQEQRQERNEELQREIFDLHEDCEDTDALSRASEALKNCTGPDRNAKIVGLARVLDRYKKENCGTGSGGFKEGNTCAVGKGGGTKSQSATKTKAKSKSKPVSFKASDDSKMASYIEKNHQSWYNGLSDDERSVLRDYASAGYIDINRALRSGKDHPAVPVMDAALERAEPLDHDLTVYRGIRGVSKLAGGDLTGGTIRDDGYLSTTLDRDMVGGFVGSDDKDSAVFRIKIPAGTKAAAINQQGRYSEEREILLPRGSSLKITKQAGQHGPVPIYEAEIVDAGSGPEHGESGSSESKPERNQRRRSRRTAPVPARARGRDHVHPAEPIERERTVQEIRRDALNRVLDRYACPGGEKGRFGKGNTCHEERAKGRAKKEVERTKEGNPGRSRQFARRLQQHEATGETERLTDVGRKRMAAEIRKRRQGEAKAKVKQEQEPEETSEEEEEETEATSSAPGLPAGRSDVREPEPAGEEYKPGTGQGGQWRQAQGAIKGESGGEAKPKPQSPLDKARAADVAATKPSERTIKLRSAHGSPSREKAKAAFIEAQQAADVFNRNIGGADDSGAALSRKEGMMKFASDAARRAEALMHEAGMKDTRRGGPGSPLADPSDRLGAAERASQARDARNVLSPSAMGRTHRRMGDPLQPTPEQIAEQSRSSVPLEDTEVIEHAGSKIRVMKKPPGQAGGSGTAPAPSTPKRSPYDFSDVAGPNPHPQPQPQAQATEQAGRGEIKRTPQQQTIGQSSLDQLEGEVRAAATAHDRALENLDDEDEIHASAARLRAAREALNRLRNEERGGPQSSAGWQGVLGGNLAGRGQGVTPPSSSKGRRTARFMGQSARRGMDRSARRHAARTWLDRHNAR